MEDAQCRIKGLKVQLQAEQAEIKVLEHQLQDWNNSKSEEELAILIKICKDQVLLQADPYWGFGGKLVANILFGIP